MTPSSEKPLRVVVYLNRFTYIRFFESVLHLLVARGHDVVLLLERKPTQAYEEEWVAELERNPNFRWRRTEALKRDRLRVLRKELRKTVDYLHFLRPRFRRAPALVQRARNRAPARAARLADLPLLRSAPARRLATSLLEAVDHALPPPQGLVDELRELGPDVLVVSPHGMPGSLDSEILKAGKSLGIPSAMAVASWDNLSSKQLVHEQPDRLLVWNETQRREAAELHGIPPERVVVTGAQNFDLWFDWQPTGREEFCARLGLDPARPYVLYVGGSLYPAELTEAEWVRGWLAALRSSDDAVLASAGVLLRPHPCRSEEWREVSYDDFENVAVWRAAYREMPVTEDARAEFFDSIHHSAAVVGLNTSALIEAAVVGRPVLTPIVPAFAGSQRGVFHFEYLLEVGGGAVTTADSLPEHVEQLATAVAGADTAAGERRARFVSEFVRPNGLDRPATPQFVDALEALPASPEARAPEPRLRPAARVLVRLVLAARRLPRRTSRARARLPWRPARPDRP